MSTQQDIVRFSALNATILLHLIEKVSLGRDLLFISANYIAI